MKLLTAVVPCYNAEAYMRRAIDSLVVGANDIEIIIVDDGSTDDTGTIADQYAARFPETVNVIHKANGGHGSGVNAGIEQARGKYLKVVDADDWLDPSAYAAVLALLREWEATGEEVDLVVTNFVYDKEGRHRKQAERYTSVMPVGRVIGWQDVGRFRPWQYMLMHSMLYRTEVLRESGLVLPEHSFYVDNLYAFIPLQYVKKLYYLDVDLYRYYVGRADQSVNERVMISRIDQQIDVNKEMFSYLSKYQHAGMPSNLRRYMLHYLEIITLVSSTLATLDNNPKLLRQKRQMWQWMKREDPGLTKRLRHGLLGSVASWRGPGASLVIKSAYAIAQRVMGFN